MKIMHYAVFPLWSTSYFYLDNADVKVLLSYTDFTVQMSPLTSSFLYDIGKSFLLGGRFVNYYINLRKGLLIESPYPIEPKIVKGNNCRVIFIKGKLTSNIYVCEKTFAGAPKRKYCPMHDFKVATYLSHHLNSGRRSLEAIENLFHYNYWYTRAIRIMRSKTRLRIHASKQRPSSRRNILTH